MKKEYLVSKIIKESNQDFIEEDLRPFLRIPSYTLNSKGVNSAIKFISSYISDFTESIKIYPGNINPLILAEVKGNSPSKLLIYCMYDTQPINKPEKWKADPFGADIMTLPPPLKQFGQLIIARGSYNSKTPLLSFLNIVKLLKQTDELPLSLLLLFDGEEEMGSPTLLTFLEDHSETFENCIDAYYPALKQDLNKKAVLKLGYKGILSFKLKAHSSNSEAHSSYANIISNPILTLIQFLSNLYSHNKIKIDSLSKKYELSTEEKELIKDLTQNETVISKIKKKAGISHFSINNPEKFFYSYLFEPTFNISTLKAGYLKEGIKNSVANTALSKIDIRFAHNVSHQLIFNQIKAYAEDFFHNSPLTLIIEKNMGYESSRVQRNSILVKSLLKSFKQLGVNTEIWPISAAASPLSRIQNALHINYITGGLGIGGNAHAANEFAQLDSIKDARLGYYYFLLNYKNLSH
jgi:acetylornithine deacetylase/succinyl-diaminopimelate desuccinylase-like protein